MKFLLDLLALLIYNNILELAVALAVAVEIEPSAADALRCQSAGQVGFPPRD